MFDVNMWFSDPAEGNNKLPKILLNGNNICMVRTFLNHRLCSLNKSVDGTRRRRQDRYGRLGRIHATIMIQGRCAQKQGCVLVRTASI